MRVDGQRESENVEDARGQGGGRSPLALGGGGLGILVLALIVYLMGGDSLRDFAKSAAALRPSVFAISCAPGPAPFASSLPSMR